MNFYFVSFSFLLLLFNPIFLAFASEPLQRSATENDQESVTTVYNNVIVSARLTTGILNGESHEFAYNTSSGAKLSELTWSFDNIFMAGIGLSMRTSSWLNFNGDLWFKITDSSTMDDFDWLAAGQPWSDWSYHDDTSLTTGTMFDINAEISFYHPDKYNFFGILGFKRDNWAWDARGGSYIYSLNGFRNASGSFPDDLLVISYEQSFNVPYLGLGFTATTDRFSFSGRVIGSTLVDASAKDIHYLRNLQFESNLPSGTMFAVDLSGFYHFTQNLFFSLAYHYQNYSELKGPETVSIPTTGQMLVIAGDSTGLDHSSSLVNFGLHYLF